MITPLSNFKIFNLNNNCENIKNNSGHDGVRTDDCFSIPGVPLPIKFIRLKNKKAAVGHSMLGYSADPKKKMRIGLQKETFKIDVDVVKILRVLPYGDDTVRYDETCYFGGMIFKYEQLTIQYIIQAMGHSTSVSQPLIFSQVEDYDQIAIINSNPYDNIAGMLETSKLFIPVASGSSSILEDPERILDYYTDLQFDRMQSLVVLSKKYAEAYHRYTNRSKIQIEIMLETMLNTQSNDVDISDPFTYGPDLFSLLMNTVDYEDEAHKLLSQGLGSNGTYVAVCLQFSMFCQVVFRFGINSLTHFRYMTLMFNNRVSIHTLPYFFTSNFNNIVLFQAPYDGVVQGVLGDSFGFAVPLRGFVNYYKKLAHKLHVKVNDEKVDHPSEEHLGVKHVKEDSSPKNSNIKPPDEFAQFNEAPIQDPLHMQPEKSEKIPAFNKDHISPSFSKPLDPGPSLQKDDKISDDDESKPITKKVVNNFKGQIQSLKSFLQDKTTNAKNISVTRMKEIASDTTFASYFKNLPEEERVIPNPLIYDQKVVLEPTLGVWMYVSSHHVDHTFQGYTTFEDKDSFKIIPNIYINYRNEHPGNVKKTNTYQLTTSTNIYKVRIPKKVKIPDNANSLDALLQHLTNDGELVLYVDKQTTIKPRNQSSVVVDNLLIENFNRCLGVLANYEFVSNFEGVSDDPPLLLGIKKVSETYLNVDCEGSTMTFPSYVMSLMDVDNKNVKNIFPKEQLGHANATLVDHLRTYGFEAEILDVIKKQVTGQIPPEFTWARNDVVQKRSEVSRTECLGGKYFSRHYSDVVFKYNYVLLEGGSNYIPPHKIPRFNQQTQSLKQYGIHYLLQNDGFIDGFANYLSSFSIEVSQTEPSDTYFKLFDIGGTRNAISTYNSSSRGFPVASDKRGTTIGYEINMYAAVKEAILKNELDIVQLMSTYYSKVKREPLEFFKNDGTYKYPRSFQVSHSIISLELSTLSNLFKRTLRDVSDNGNLLGFSLMSKQFSFLAKIINGDIVGDKYMNFSDNVFSAQTIKGKRIFSSLDVKNAEASIGPPMYELYYQVLTRALPKLSGDTKEYLKIFLKNQWVNSMVAPVDSERFSEVYMDFMPSGLFCTTDLNHINTSLLLYLVEIEKISIMEDVGVMTPEFLDLCAFLGIKMTISLSEVVEYRSEPHIFGDLRIFKADLLGYDIVKLPNGEYAPILNYERFLKQVIFFRGIDYTVEKAFIIQKSIIVNGWAYKAIIPVYSYLVKNLHNPSILNLIQSVSEMSDENLVVDPQLAPLLANLRGGVLPPSIRSIFKTIGISASAYSFLDDNSIYHKMLAEGDEVINDIHEDNFKMLVTPEAFSLMKSMIERRRREASVLDLRLTSKNPNTLEIRNRREDIKQTFNNPDIVIPVPSVLFIKRELMFLIDPSTEIPFSNANMGVMAKIIKKAHSLGVPLSEIYGTTLMKGDSGPFLPRDKNLGQNRKFLTESILKVIGRITNHVKDIPFNIKMGDKLLTPDTPKGRIDIVTYLILTLGKHFLDKLEKNVTPVFSYPDSGLVVVVPAQEGNVSSALLGWVRDNMEKFQIEFKHGSKIVTHKNVNAEMFGIPIVNGEAELDENGFYYTGPDNFSTFLNNSPFLCDHVLLRVLTKQGVQLKGVSSTKIKILQTPLIAKLKNKGGCYYPFLGSGIKVSNNINTLRIIKKHHNYTMNPFDDVKVSEIRFDLDDINNDNYKDLIINGHKDSLKFIKVKDLPNVLRTSLILEYKVLLTDTLLTVRKHLSGKVGHAMTSDHSCPIKPKKMSLNRSHSLPISNQQMELRSDISGAFHRIQLENIDKPFCMLDHELSGLVSNGKTYVFMVDNNIEFIEGREAYLTKDYIVDTIDLKVVEFVKPRYGWVPAGLKKLYIDSSVKIGDVKTIDGTAIW